MDLMTLLRTFGALSVVLGILASALWVVRRYGITLPGQVRGRSDRRLGLIEKLSIDPRRSIALIRRDGFEHLILIAPEGHLVIEQSIVRSPVDEAAREDVEQPFWFPPSTPSPPDAEPVAPQSFGDLVRKVADRDEVVPGARATALVAAIRVRWISKSRLLLEAARALLAALATRACAKARVLSKRFDGFVQKICASPKMLAVKGGAEMIVARLKRALARGVKRDA